MSELSRAAEQSSRAAAQAKTAMTLLSGFAIIAFSLFVAPTIRELINPIQVESKTALDAKIGSRLDVPRQDIFGRNIEPSRKYLLVFAGTCTGCSINAVSQSEFVNAPFDQVVLAYLATPEQIIQEFPNSVPKVRIVADAKGILVKQLGAVSAPRFDLVEDEILVSIWKDIKSKPTEWLRPRP